MSESTRLSQVLHLLPPEAHQTLLENHLLALVDLVPKEKSKQILTAATNLKQKYDAAPKLDLRAKRNQITMLLDELTRDAKSSFIKERSNREELLSEIVQSLVEWLNPIWSAVFEHHIGFLHAHNCLLFVTDALAQLADNSLGGCKCSVMNLPIQFTLKDKNGKVLKRFTVLGPQNLNRIMLWIWRDLLVSILAYGTDREKSKVPEFLEDVELGLGIRALGNLIYGGKSDDEDDGSDSEYDEQDFDALLTDYSFDNYCEDYSDDESEPCTCSLHAPYWPERLNRERFTLRKHIENRLFYIFELTPSLEIYNILMSTTAYQTEKRADKILARVAGDTPTNLAAALDIHVVNGDAEQIAKLLKSYSYLLRPRDAPTLQCAVTVLYEDDDYRAMGMLILDKELNECLRAIYGLVWTSFAQIEAEANKKDMQEILKLRNGTSERKERVLDWAEHVVTASSGPMHPMAFAAMMMGLPMMPGTDDGDDADILSYVDLDRDDPDMDDLRDAYRPNLKAIFEGWTDVGQTLKGGSLILAKLYMKALELMPWLRGSDVVAEMTNRLRERPNKIHVLDALANLSAFAKAQRKKLNHSRSEIQRRNTTKASGNTVTQTPSNGTLSNPPSVAPPPPSPPAVTVPHTHSAPPPPPPPGAQPIFIPFAFGGLAVNSTTIPILHPPGPSVEDVD